MACRSRGKTHQAIFVVYKQIATSYFRLALLDVIIPDHFSVRKTLIAKAVPTSLPALIVTAILLIASSSPLLAQRGRERSERQSPEAERQAEESFRQALLSSGTTDRKSTRLRLQEAMSIWTRMREPEKAAQAALQIGDRYRQARRYQDALDYYDLALGVKSLPGSIRASALNAAALVYAELYLDNLAVRYFIKARDQARLISDLPAQEMALIGLAHLYYRQSAREQALTCIEQAQRLNRRLDADADPALLYLTGRIRQEEGAMEKAKNAFEEALAAYKKNGDVAGQIKTMCAISNLLLSSHKQAALEEAEQAVKLSDDLFKRKGGHADKTSANESRWPAYLSRARAFRALGQKERADSSYQRAIGFIEGLGVAVYNATETSAVAFREETQAAYREYVDLLMEQEQFEKAYGFAERVRARTLRNWIAARQATPVATTNDQEASLSEQNQSIINLRLKMLASGISPIQQSKLQKEIEDAEAETQKKLLKAEMENSRSRLVYSKIIDAEELRKKMSEDRMVLAEFFLGENRSFVWLFTGGDVFSETLPGRREIETAVESYLTSLSAVPNPVYIEKEIDKLRKQGRELFARLFGRLTDHIAAGQRLIIVPDGLLHYLPFETLIHNSRYLVEDHEISYNPSASMLGLWQNDEEGDSGSEMELLAIGDPIVEPGAKIGESGNGLSEQARRMLLARGFRLSQLPRTREEVLSLADLFPSDRRKVLLGSDATEEAVKLESLRRYRRLHFASHSLVDERSPLRSAVVLTPGDQAKEDGLLEAGEISRLDLDCDLAVVSACQTGRGRLLSGEGIVGLSRAFLLAGARAVVVSLRNVSDASTSRLMKNFYRNLTEGSSNAAALRKAKLEMIQSGRQTRHPYYWSSFVIIGKP
jgi:CHAT domain-containing protein